MTREESAAVRAEARAQRRGRPRTDGDEPQRLSADGEEPAAEGEEEEPKERDRPQRPKPQRSEQRPQKGVAPEKLPGIAATAREVLRSLRGIDAESVSGVARTPQGWRVTLEVVELRRVPESTDVLASYEVDLDDDGGLVRFERGRRYNRSQAERGSR